jgi:hypothetical protein
MAPGSRRPQYGPISVRYGMYDRQLCVRLLGRECSIGVDVRHRPRNSGPQDQPWRQTCQGPVRTTTIPRAWNTSQRTTTLRVIAVAGISRTVHSALCNLLVGTFLPLSHWEWELLLIVGLQRTTASFVFTYCDACMGNVEDLECATFCVDGIAKDILPRSQYLA